MQELMIWDNDDHPSSSQDLLQPLEVKLPSRALPEPEAPKVTFRDVLDGSVCTGNVLRTITSNEHTNARLGKLPVVTLYLVAFASAKRKDDLTVIDPSLIIHPPKPRP